MALVEKLDDYGKGAWIGLMVLGFIVFWPFGLGILAYLIWSGRMACWTHGDSDRWQRRMDRLQSKMERMQQRAARWCGGPGHHSSRPSAGPTGNRAFDEYREETLRRLEDEQREFFDFLERLRHAKDKAEFDQFMAERRRSNGQAPGAEPAAG